MTGMFSLIHFRKLGKKKGQYSEGTLGSLPRTISFEYMIKLYKMFLSLFPLYFEISSQYCHKESLQ